MRLSELKTGEKGVIVKVLGHGGFRKRIVEMGFIKGKTVEVLLNAPLKDPIKYKVLGYEISLRRQEAEMIEVISEEEAKKLAETTVYLACSPKSNSAYMAINDALALVNRTGNLPVPLHLRNAPTKLMAELEYGKEYKYAHDYENHFVKQEYLPKEILGERLWKGQENPAEHKLIEQMRRLWGDRF